VIQFVIEQTCLFVFPTILLVAAPLAVAVFAIKPRRIDMKFNVIHNGLRAGFCAALLLGVAAVQAATGYTVTSAQEKQISVGMTRDMVRTTLGRPAHNVKFRAEPGRTWTYGVVGTLDKVFDIDFSSDGKVTSMSERSENIE
jgi:uncharacterized membrane protein